MTITGTSVNTATADATADAGGLVSGIGAESSAAVVPSVSATTGGDSQIDAASEISVAATVTPQAIASANGVSAGGVSVGASVASATDSPTLTATAGGAGTTVVAQVLDVNATSQLPTNAGNADSTSANASGSFGALVGAAASSATANDAGAVSSSIANGTTLYIAKSVDVAANGSSDQSALASGKASGLIVAGSNTATAGSSAQTSATVGSDVVSSSGDPVGGLQDGAIYYVVPDPSDSALISLASSPENALASSASDPLQAGSGAVTITLAQPAFSGLDDSLTPVDVVGAAPATFDPATDLSQSGGTSTIEVANNSFYLGEPVQYEQSSGPALAISADGDDINYAQADAGSGGVVAGAAATANTNTAGGASASIADNTGPGTSLDVSSLTITAQHTAQFDSQTNTIEAAVAGDSGSWASNTDSSTVNAHIGNDAQIVTQSLQVLATNMTEKNLVPAGQYNVSAAAGGVLEGNAAQSTTTIANFTTADVGAGANINVTGSTANPGLFELYALNNVIGSDSVNLDTGGVIDGSDATSTIDAGTNDATAQIGPNATIYTVGDINLDTRTTADLTVAPTVHTYGLASPGAIDGEATIAENDAVNVGAGAFIQAQGNLNLIAGGDMSGELNNLSAGSDAYELNASAVPALELTSKCEIDQNNTVNVGASAMLLAAGNANLDGEQDGNAVTNAQGTGKDWITAVVGGDTHAGTGIVNTTTTVTVDGTIQLGIDDIQSLTIQEDILDHPTDYTVSGPISFYVDSQNLVTDLTTELANLESLAADYAGDTAAVNAYNTEIQQIEFELTQLGLSETESDSSVVYASDAFVPFVNLAPIFAQAGTIFVNAANFEGDGSLIGPAPVSITVTNNSPAYLSVGPITIPQSTGTAVFFDGNSVASDSAIGVVNQNQTAPSFDIKAAAASAAPTVTITNTYSATAPGNAGFEGDDFGTPDIDINGNISAPPTVLVVTSQGNVIVSANIDVGTVTVNSGDSFIQSYTPGIDSIAGDPSTLWSNVTSLTEAAGASLSPLPYPVTANPSGTAIEQAVATALATPAGSNIMAANDVFVSAEYLNIDGTIQSGEPDLQVTIDNTVQTLSNPDIPEDTYYESMDGAISDAAFAYQEYESGDFSDAQNIVSGDGLFTNDFKEFLLPEPTNDNIDVYYDAPTGQLVLGQTDVQGGLVELYGDILSTGNGNINVLDGNGAINVTNDTSYPLVTSDLSTGDGTAGLLKITDTGQEELVPVFNGRLSFTYLPLVTEYYRQNGQVETTSYYANPNGSVNSVVSPPGPYTGPNAGPRTASYQPATARFVWEDGQDETVTVTNVYQTSSWLSVVNLGASNLVSTTTTYGNSEPLLQGEWIDNAADDSSLANVAPGSQDDPDYIYNFQVIAASSETFGASDLENGNELDLPGNAFLSGDPVIFTADPNGSVSGLESGTEYYAIVDPSNPALVSLATSMANATASPPVAIPLGTITGTQNTIAAATENLTTSKSETWWGKITYTYTLQTYAEDKNINTNSIRADWPINITFTGNDPGASGQVVSVSTDGDLLIDGSIQNAAGTTILSAPDGSIQPDSSAATVGGQNITLTAGNGIGGAAPLLIDMTNTSAAPYTALGTLNATSSSGSINIDNLAGSMAIGQVITAQGTGNVTLSADDSILAASAGSLIEGGAIDLTASFGSVGSLGTGGTADSPAADALPIIVDVGAAIADNLSVTSQGDVFVRQSTGDLRVDIIDSSAGNIRVEVPDGNLVDANNISVPDTQNLSELEAQWNSMLATQSTAQVSVNDTITAYENEIDQEYQTYWMFRDEQPDPSVYDPTFQVTLPPAQLAAWTTYFTNEGTAQGLSGSALATFVSNALTTLANTDTQEYHAYNAIFGKLGNSYDPSYMYFANQTPLSGSVTLTFGAADIDATGYLIDLPGNGYVTGQAVVYNANGGSVGGLTTGNTYFVSVDSSDPSEISLASSYANATAASPVLIQLSPVTGTDNVLATIFQTFSAAQVDPTGLSIDLPQNVFTTGEAVIYHANGGSVGGLTDGDTYYVIVDPNKTGNSAFIGLASSYANATASRPVPIKLTDVTGTGNYLSEVDVLAERAAWTQTQLQDSANLSILEPVLFPSTVQAIPDPNLEGKNIAIVVSGSIGTVSGMDTIPLPITAALPEQEALDLAAAQPADVTYYNAGPNGTLVPVSPSNPSFNPVELIISLQKGISIENTALVDATAGQDINLQSGQDVANHGALLPITLDLVTAMGGVSSGHPDGVVRIQGLDGIANGQPAGGVNIIGGDLYLEGGNTGGIGTSALPIVIDLAPGALLEEANAELGVFISEVNGGLNLVTAFSATGDVDLTADGSILNGNAESDVNVDAVNAILMAGADGDKTNMIGTSAAPLQLEVSGSVVAQAYLDVSLDAVSGDLLVNEVDSLEGDAFLTSTLGSILDDHTPTMADPVDDVIADSITLTAGSLGSIGTATDSLEIDVAETGTLTATSGQNAYITQPVGDLNLGAVSASNGGRAFIEAPAGNIFNGVPAGQNTLNIQAGSAYLLADDNIGSAASPITSAVSTVQAQSTTGSIWLIDNGTLTIGGVQSGGTVNITAMSPITITKSIDAVGNITLTSTHDTSRGDMVAASGASIDSSAGSVFLQAGDNFTQDAGDSIQAANSITIAGDYGNLSGTGAQITLSGSIDAPRS